MSPCCMDCNAVVIAGEAQEGDGGTRGPKRESLVDVGGLWSPKRLENILKQVLRKVIQPQ